MISSHTTGSRLASTRAAIATAWTGGSRVGEPKLEVLGTRIAAMRDKEEQWHI